MKNKKISKEVEEKLKKFKKIIDEFDINLKKEENEYREFIDKIIKKMEKRKIKEVKKKLRSK